MVLSLFKLVLLGLKSVIPEDSHPALHPTYLQEMYIALHEKSHTRASRVHRFTKGFGPHIPSERVPRFTPGIPYACITRASFYSRNLTRVHHSLKRVHRACIVLLMESHHTPFRCIARASFYCRNLTRVHHACIVLLKDLKRVHRACIVLLKESHHTPFSTYIIINRRGGVGP